MALAAAPAALAAQAVDSATLAGIRWRSVGPAVFEGRIADIRGIPFPSRTLFVAAAAGGVWKSTNGGVTFRPVFDDKPVMSMGALAIAPSDTMQVWAGTGEQNSRNSIEPGAGIYKSTDGGITWRLMGLEKTQHIGRIVVHPRNPNIVYVAALGAAWATNPERGLYKTTDGGQTWNLVKFISDRAGFVDVELDPSNPDIIWATSWERIRGPYYLKSGGPGSALWKSTDAGATWTEVKGTGWPETQKGRMNLAIFPGDGRIVYAIVEADSTPNTRTGQPPQQLKNGLYRTTDGGANWEKMHDSNTRPFYYSMIEVHPTKSNRVWFSSTPMLVSNDGGRTSYEALRDVHIDTHALWIDSGDPEHMAVGNDGGVYLTWDGGGAWDFGEYLPIGQFYEVSYDFRVPYHICGGAQDNGSWCGPSRRKNGNAQNSYWFMVTGGDGFYTQQHPKEPWIVWSESQGGNIQRSNLRTGESVGLQKPGYRPRYLQVEDSIMVIRGDTMRAATREVQRQITDMRTRQVNDSIEGNIRYNWNTPYFLSPHNPDVLYAGGSRVLKSNNRGDGLFTISPDLSKKQWAKIDTSMNKTGGITRDATGAETYGTVVALAESPRRQGWLMAGTDDGNVWLTQNDGGSWQQVPMSRFPGIPAGDIYSGKFEASRFDDNTFYVTFDNHRNNDFTPYVYVTTDWGRTFRSIANNLPKDSPADYARVLREDPANRDLLFVGTSRAVYYSLDRGASWSRFMSGMPNVPIYDLQIHPRDRELIAATHGRSFWIVDIQPLSQMTQQVMAANAHLFAPRVAFDYGEMGNFGEAGYGHGHKTFQFPSPTHGAEISYRIGSAATATNGAAGGGQGRGGRGGGAGASILVADALGDTVAVVNGPGTPGLHKVFWNFRGRAVPVRVALGPSQLRDSTNVARRITAIFDSVGRAGSVPQASLDRMKTALLSGQIAGGGGRGGGGGGGRGAAPPTGWVDRPGEGTDVIGGRGRGAGAGGGGGGAGGGGAAQDPFADFPGGAEALAALLRPRGAPAFTGRGGGAGEITQRLSAFTGGGGGGRGGGGGGGGGAAPLVPPGDYVITLNIGGQTYRQKLRVERVEGFGDVPR